MDTQTSESDVAMDEATSPLRSLCDQLEACEKLSQEELVHLCKNLETTIRLKDKEIERINKHTDYILGMYYEVEDKLAQRNNELVSCQAGLKEVQEVLNQWRRELACSSLSTESSRYHPSTTPEISSGTGSSEGDYKVSLQRDVDMEEGNMAPGVKWDILPTEYQMQKDNKNERKKSRKGNSYDLLGKNMHPVLHRRQQNSNNNSSSYDLESSLCRADRKSPLRPDLVDPQTQDTKRRHRPQPLPKPLYHSVNGPLRVIYDNRQMAPQGNIVSRSMALAATDRKCEDANAGLRMSFFRKVHDTSEEHTYLGGRKAETGYHILNGAGFYERSSVIVADVNDIKNGVNGNGRLSPGLRVASRGGVDGNDSEKLAMSQVEPGSLEEDHSTVKKCDLIDAEKCQFSEEAFVHNIIESLIRHVCGTEYIE